MDYRSMSDWFTTIERKLKNVSVYAFYFVFPQLVRFLRDQNKAKVEMDKYYSQKLRAVPVSRKFIFHTVSTYSELIDVTKK